MTGQGRYYDPVHINRPLTLRAMDASAQLNAVHNLPALTLDGSDIVIEGFAITAPPNAGNYPVGISVSNYLRGSYTGVAVRNNNLKNLRQAIVFSMNSGEIAIEGNTLDNNQYGLYMSLRYYTSAKSIRVTENTFIDNTTAFTGNANPGAEKLYVFNNNFIDNEQQAMPNGAQPVSYDTGGNHWSNHVSPDLLNGPAQDVSGSDGIVDIAYSGDAYPFVEPNGWQFQNTAPNAYLSAPAQLILGEDALLDASASWDPEGALEAYDFDFGNQHVYREDTTGAPDGLLDGQTTYRYPAAGIYQVTATVTDAHGAQASAVATVEVLSLADALGDLIAAIQAGGLAKGPENALVVKVKAAIKALAAGDSLTAKQSLGDLMDQLQANGFCANKAPEGFCTQMLPKVERVWRLL